MKPFARHIKEAVVSGWNEIVKSNPMIQTAVDLLGEIEKLQKGGEALIVGGVVRDILLKRPIHDVDIATNVELDLIRKHFRTSEVSERGDFGIVLVHFGDFKYEVAHYRQEKGSADHRHPDAVTQVGSFEADSARRDLTINSLGVDQRGTIIDYQGGVQDLKNRIVRAVGEPRERFTEDALRILRVARFASQLGFEIEDKTRRSMQELAELVDTVSKERVAEELFKAATSGKTLASYVEHLDRSGLLERILPEVKQLQGLTHNPQWHPEGDSYEHTLAALRVSRSNDPLTNVAILFHDLGKGVTAAPSEHGPYMSFHGHEKDSERLSREVGKRLKFSNEQINAIAFAARHHMWMHKLAEIKLSKLAPVVNSPYWDLLKDVSYADNASTGNWSMVENDAQQVAAAEAKIRQMSQSMELDALQKRLNGLINGHMILEWFPDLAEKSRRPIIGQIIQTVQDRIVNEDLFNASEDQIRAMATEVYQQFPSFPG